MTANVPFARPPGGGWLALLGGGEFSFGETLDADRAWIDRTPAGPISFLPAASGSVDYPQHFGAYLRETFARELETLPVYRGRDARREKNAQRVAEVAAIYLGGGVPDHLLEAIAGTPVATALEQRLAGGGTVAAIAAAAQCLGTYARSIFGGEVIAGLGWLAGGVLEPNFDPEHDRRLRQLMRQPGVRWGVGIPAGAALLLGPDGAMEVIDQLYVLGSADGDYTVLEEEDDPSHLM
ncbi:MAG TPA: Type 1 glutamine amidotransferase-like domain-containing protein [Thermoanaerobaculia bacterium]|jgi:cyanophycinase-like exopeptidase|nr:Type 1 glutamine amidotransferase-like domain-containing protein [Thermoanaerobaculia bacterium]